MSIPIYDATAPVACTAGLDEINDRIAQIERMRDAMVSVERTDVGLLLHFEPAADTEAELRQFAIDEKGCCQFWGFEVRSTDAEVTLRWDGPPSVDELLDRLSAWFQSDEPLTPEIGLL